ncbi:MAG: Bro-N domain-containing protein [Oscillospiraceae bacterium]|nr:Bro-N domain-containing protein [Oscillospiraceae bacterium]
MKDENNFLKLFEDKKIRVYWDANEEKWYFSVIDIIFALTDSKDPNDYWYKLKIRVNEESKIELSTICRRLKLPSKDGKKYNTDCADIKGIFRIIQSVPSPKAEPLKLWLARVGSERIDEDFDPELAINRALNTYRRKGYSEEWINQRLKSIDVRKEFTDELKRSGINTSKDFAILTNVLTSVWSGYSVKEYKQLKGLKKENLRDNMTNMEIVLNMLAETSSTEISKGTNPKGFDESKNTVIEGATVAKVAKDIIEKKSGKKIVSSKNANQIRNLNNNKLA